MTTRVVVLGMLFLVYAFNFVDRQIIGILAIPIKAELHLSDTQLGLMGGIAFALFYTALGVPVALAADRRRRTAIIAGALALWSLFTALCGLAGSFGQLFLCRLGVGIGEAGGVAPSYSLISDYFPPRQRARAIAFYSLGIPIGSGLGILLGGYVATQVSWRAAFVVIGAAGLVLAPVFLLLVREPARGRYDAAMPERTGLGPTMRMLGGKPAFWLLSFGAASTSMLGYGLAFWLPAFFARSFQLDLMAVAQFYGAILLIGGIAGILLGGWLGDRIGARNPGGYAYVPACASLLALPLSLVALLAKDVNLAFLLFLVPQALSLVWLGPIITAVQYLVPANMRATASALFLFINNLMGIGIGTLLFGWLSEQLSAELGAEALRWSIILGSAVFYPVAAMLFILAGRILARDRGASAGAVD